MLDWPDIIYRFGAAMLIGSSIGIYLELHQKPTGMRTLGLVSLSIGSCGFGCRSCLEKSRCRRKQGYPGRYGRCRIFGCGRDRASRKRRAGSARAFDCGDDLDHCILGRIMWSRCLAALGRRVRPDRLAIDRGRRN